MDLGSIYRRAWEITTKHKILWFFGAIVAIFVVGGGGGASYNSLINSDSDSSSDAGGDTKIDYEQYFAHVVNQLQMAFAQVPVHVWVLLLAGIVVSTILGLLISYVARAWALGSFINGIEMALSDKELSVKEISKAGFKNFRSMLWLVAIPGLLLGLVILALLIGLVVIGLVTQGPWLSLIMGVPIFLVLFVVGIIIAMIQVWAVRLAALEGLSGQESFRQGWAMVKTYFGEMFVVGLINKLMSCLLGCMLYGLGCLVGLVIILPIVLIIVGMAIVSPVLAIVVGAGIFSVIVAVMSTTIFLMGAYLTFNFSTWNILYRQLKGKS